ncbi:MAG: hypothetical protein FWG82_01825 [Oscillospiraceae bacterium]|nr:hypothetical protein [Oscillospiraceae bacterium]
MARYELGAVYKISADDETVYYARLLTHDSYGVFEPLNGELSEDALSKLPYRLYFSCNSFAVKRGIWEKILPSSDKNDAACSKTPDLANFGTFNANLFLEQHRVFRDGNPYVCDKEYYIPLVKAGMIENIFNRHENVPSFLRIYYEGWPNSYILDKTHILSGTAKFQKEKLDALKEIGFDVTDLGGKNK